MRNLLRAGIWIGFIGSGLSLMILIEQPLNRAAAYMILVSLLLTTVSAFIYGLIKEDTYVRYS